MFTAGVFGADYRPGEICCVALDKSKEMTEYFQGDCRFDMFVVMMHNSRVSS